MENDDRKEEIRQFINWTEALIRSMEVSQKNENPSNVWKFGGYRQFARKYNQILTAVAAKFPLPPVLDMFDLEKMPGINDTLASNQKEYFEAVHANASVLKAYLEGQLGVVEDARMALRDFVSSQTSKRHFQQA